MAAKTSKKTTTKTRRTRKLKTKKGIDRQTSSLLSPTKKRRRNRKKMAPAKKLAARKAKVRQNKRKTVKDKVFDIKRGAVNAKRRTAKKGKVIVSKKGSKTKHNGILGAIAKKAAGLFKKAPPIYKEMIPAGVPPKKYVTMAQRKAMKRMADGMNNVKISKTASKTKHYGLIRGIAKQAWKHPKTAMGLAGGVYVAGKVTKRQLDSRM